MIKYKFLSKMSFIELIERIPHPFEIFKTPYLTQKWINFNEPNLYWLFIMIKDRLLLKMSRISPLERKLGTIRVFSIRFQSVHIQSTATERPSDSVMTKE